MAFLQINAKDLLDGLSSAAPGRFQDSLELHPQLRACFFSGQPNLQALDFSRISWEDIEQLPVLSQRLQRQCGLPYQIFRRISDLPACADTRRRFC